MASHLGKFVWHDLMSTDVDAAVGFYGELFPEWNIEALPMEGFTYNMILAAGLKMGGIVPFEGPEGVPSHWIAYVGVEDCDAAVEKAKELGGGCCMPAHAAPGVGKFAIINDPQNAFIKPFQMANPQAPPEIPAEGQFCWDELLTSDVASAREFYAKLFGWDYAVHEMGEMGQYTLFKDGERDFAGCMQMPPQAEAPPFWLPYVMVSDVDARAAKVAELGGHIYREPGDIPNVGRFAVLADPTGASFAVYKSLAGGL